MLTPLMPYGDPFPGAFKGNLLLPPRLNAVSHRINDGRARCFHFIEGAGSTGTDYMRAADVSGTASWSGQSARFKRASTHVLTGSDTGLPSGTADRTVWVKFRTNYSSGGVGDYNWLFAYGSQSTNQAFALLLGDTTISPPNSVLMTQHGGSVTSPTPVNDGQWHNLFCTYDSTGTRLYVDSSSLNASGAPAVNTVLNGTLCIGKRYVTTAANDYYEGDIAAVSVWSRVLSAPEMDLLMAWPYAGLQVPGIGDISSMVSIAALRREHPELFISD